METHHPGQEPPPAVLTGQGAATYLAGLMSEDCDVVEECADALHATVDAVRPVLDFLTVRAWPALPVREACTKHAVETRVSVLAAGYGIIEELDPATGGGEPARDRFLAAMAAEHTRMLAEVTSDVIDVELFGITSLLDHHDIRLALDEGGDLVGGPTLALVLLGDGTTPIARATRFPHPVVAERDDVVSVAQQLDEPVLRRLLGAFARGLTALRRVGPLDRARAMIAKATNSADRRAARPGTGYIDIGTVARLTNITVGSAKAKISAAQARMLNAYADPSAPIAMVGRPALVTARWGLEDD